VQNLRIFGVAPALIRAEVLVTPWVFGNRLREEAHDLNVDEEAAITFVN